MEMTDDDVAMDDVSFGGGQSAEGPSARAPAPPEDSNSSLVRAASSTRAKQASCSPNAPRRPAPSSAFQKLPCTAQRARQHRPGI